jgi:phage tail-like protein
MPSDRFPALLGTSHFRVLIGRRELGFAEVSRLSSETDVTLPPEERSHRFATVVLRRALSDSTELFDWRRRIVGGKDDRRRVTIQQLDAAGGAVVNAWRLERAWPCRWSGPDFDAVGTDVAIEELELAYDDLVWLSPADEPPPEPTRSRRKRGA